MKKLIFLLIVGLIGIFSINLSAQNDYYKMDNIKTQYYINASRNAVNNNNLSQACVLARKAIQANSWSKKAWANYDDIVKRLVKSGKVKDFTMPQTLTSNTSKTVAPAQPAQAAPAPTPAAAPSPSGGGSQYEGC
jgi:cytoskeletal protein RodZ